LKVSYCFTPEYSSQMKSRNATKKKTSPSISVPSVPVPTRELNVWTDGACLANGQSTARAGIGIYFAKSDARNLSERLSGQRQTNQRAELMASIRAIEIVRSGEAEYRNSDAKEKEHPMAGASKLTIDLPTVASSPKETLVEKEDATKKRKKMSSKTIDQSAMDEHSREEPATGKKKRKTKASEASDALVADSTATNTDNPTDEPTITLSPISVIPKRLLPLIKPVPISSVLSPTPLFVQPTQNPTLSNPIPNAVSMPSHSLAIATSIPPPTPLVVRIHTDSKYVILGATSWTKSWKANQWRRGKGKPTEKNAIVNLDLWQRLDRLIEGDGAHSDSSGATSSHHATKTNANSKAISPLSVELIIEWKHVEGHSGDVGNEAADKLAKSACYLDAVERNGDGE
jgi:ribonuclease HI